MSLETGTPEVFAPARRLYQQMGFEPCAPFGSYRDSRFNICMTLQLPEPGEDATFDAP